MKRLILLLLPFFLGGCMTLPGKSTSDSTGTNTTGTSGTNSNTDSDGDTGTDSDSDTDTDEDTDIDPVIPDVEKKTIAEIKALDVGTAVSFEATYLRKLSPNSSEVVMYFADTTGTIGFRISNSPDYINNCYRFKEYRITGQLVSLYGKLEVKYDSSITSDYHNAVIRLGDTTELSYNENTTTLPVQLDDIGDIKDIATGITYEGNKKNGYAEGLVKFTAQYAQNEREKSSEKTMFIDDNDESIVVIMDGDGTKGHPLYDLRIETNIGKYYEITGIISVKDSIPAIYGLKAKYVSHTQEEEESFYVNDAIVVTDEIATKLFKGNLTTDKFNPLANEDYFKLYKAEGWVKQNTDITTSVNLGLTLTESGSLSDAGSTNTVKGFYFVNGVTLKTSELQYCPFYSLLGTKIEIYFKIESYNTSNHIWNIFVIESLLGSE